MIELERAFALLARSDQREAFVGLKVDAQIIDWLLSEGNVNNAIALLQQVTNHRLLPKLTKHIICAREAYLNSRDIEHPRPTSQPVGHIVPRR